ELLTFNARKASALGNISCLRQHVRREDCGRIRQPMPDTRLIPHMGRPLKGLALGLVIGLLGSLATWLPRVSQIEEDLELNWLFQLRGPVQAPAEVVVVAIDEESARRLGLPSKPSDWPRELHARLVDRLARAGARVICFDLTFDTPSR